MNKVKVCHLLLKYFEIYKTKRLNSSLDSIQVQEQKQEKQEKQASSHVQSDNKTDTTVISAGMVTSMDNKSKKKNKKNKKKSNVTASQGEATTSDDILFSSKVYEKQKLREFWLQLRDEDRKSIVRMERDDVLRKMKEQQKMSCSCHTCGKKKYKV